MFALTIALAATASGGITDLSWMAGHWLECTAHGETAETWTDGRGNVMLGISKTIRDGRAGWEWSRIAMSPEGTTFFASPKGQSPAAFKAILITSGKVVFENLDHDFPQRVIYMREGDRLTGRIEGKVNGKVKSFEWHYELASLNGTCPASAP